MKSSGVISSPGRICLFGEHQDYLGLPVIPMAIDRRLYLNYQFITQNRFIRFRSNQIYDEEQLNLEVNPKLTGGSFDYLISVINYFWEKLHKYQLPNVISIDSFIPIKAGLSSSAALLTSMVFLLTKVILKEKLSTETIAEISYQCERNIMQISCGRMDQYASALGGIFHMTSKENPKLLSLNIPNEAIFVVGNSEIKRKADIPLKKVQDEIFQTLSHNKVINLEEFTFNSSNTTKFSMKQKKLMKGIIGIRDVTIEALSELKRKKPDLERIGDLLNIQQSFLTQNYNVSHPKLDKMCQIALDSGALGAKLTGAGFGGCMFALTDEKKRAMKIKDKLTDFGYTFTTKIDSGVLLH